MRVLAGDTELLRDVRHRPAIKDHSADEQRSSTWRRMGINVGNRGLLASMGELGSSIKPGGLVISQDPKCH